MKNFWTKLNKPFFCLAPMEEVTDVAFREMFARYGVGKSKEDGGKIEGVLLQSLSLLPPPSSLNPFVMYTEFINVDGLTHPEGYKKLSIDLKFTEIQRPIVAQLWGINPEKFYEATKIVVDLGFDGVDINMGCPQTKEIQMGACAALIREPDLAIKIIEAVKKAAGDLPVSVKTRIGYSSTDEMEEWVTALLKTNISALALHGRTKQEMSKVPAHWDVIGRAVKIRDEVQGARAETERTLIIGNGDVKSRAEGLERVKETGCDGIMIARGAFGNPWIFREDNHQPSTKERLSTMLEHAHLFNELLGNQKSFVIMRKHFKAYVSGFDGAHELRAKLMETKNLQETEELVRNYLK